MIGKNTPVIYKALNPDLGLKARKGLTRKILATSNLGSIKEHNKKLSTKEKQLEEQAVHANSIDECSYKDDKSSRQDMSIKGQITQDSQLLFKYYNRKEKRIVNPSVPIRSKIKIISNQVHPVNLDNIGNYRSGV